MVVHRIWVDFARRLVDYVGKYICLFSRTKNPLLKRKSIVLHSYPLASKFQFQFFNPGQRLERRGPDQNEK
jgi:hypothetical protein